MESLLYGFRTPLACPNSPAQLQRFLFIILLKIHSLKIELGIDAA